MLQRNELLRLHCKLEWNWNYSRKFSWDQLILILWQLIKLRWLSLSYRRILIWWRCKKFCHSVNKDWESNGYDL
jgi:hypothetical protein